MCQFYASQNNETLFFGVKSPHTGATGHLPMGIHAIYRSSERDDTPMFTLLHLLLNSDSSLSFQRSAGGRRIVARESTPPLPLLDPVHSDRNRHTCSPPIRADFHPFYRCLSSLRHTNPTYESSPARIPILSHIQERFPAADPPYTLEMPIAETRSGPPGSKGRKSKIEPEMWILGRPKHRPYPRPAHRLSQYRLTSCR